MLTHPLLCPPPLYSYALLFPPPLSFSVFPPLPLDAKLVFIPNPAAVNLALILLHPPFFLFTPSSSQLSGPFFSFIPHFKIHFLASQPACPPSPLVFDILTFFFFFALKHFKCHKWAHESFN